MTERSTSGAGHILRIVICLSSFGFIFPHALMEKADAERDAAAKLALLAKIDDSRPVSSN